MAVKAALRWTEEERRCHRLTAALWPWLLEIQNGLGDRFACKRKAWQAGAYLSSTDVPYIMVYFEYRANSGRLNKPPLDGIRKFLTSQAKRSGLVLNHWRSGKSTYHATLRLPKELVPKIAAGSKVLATQKKVARKKVRGGNHH